MVLPQNNAQNIAAFFYHGENSQCCSRPSGRIAILSEIRNTLFCEKNEERAGGSSEYEAQRDRGERVLTKSRVLLHTIQSFCKNRNANYRVK